MNKDKEKEKEKETEKDKDMICNNCGLVGHQSNECKMPIISSGVIVYRIHPETQERQYLMICRKDSFGFSDFLYTKPSQYNQLYVTNIVNEMTSKEKAQIIRCIESIRQHSTSPSFDSLTSASSPHYQRSLSPYGAMFGDAAPNVSKSDNQILKRIHVIQSHLEETNSHKTLYEILKDSENDWSDCEWGFPKGRRNLYEKDIGCALREFEEETGYNKSALILYENIVPYEEIFIGSNNKCYKHKYFVAKMKYTDTLDTSKFQKSEVSKMEWKSYSQCIESVRPYNIEKKLVIKRVKKCLETYKII